MYQVGQRVEHEDYGLGTIILIDNRYRTGELLIEFDKPNGFMHKGQSYDGTPKSDKNNCWWVEKDDEDLSLIMDEKFVLFNRHEGA